MTWENVLPGLTLIASAVVGITTLFWTSARILRPWMRNEVRKGMDELYDRMKGNDFKHVESQIAGVNDRLDRMDDRLDRMDDRMVRMAEQIAESERRILAALVATHGGSHGAPQGDSSAAQGEAAGPQA